MGDVERVIAIEKAVQPAIAEFGASYVLSTLLHWVKPLFDKLPQTMRPSIHSPEDPFPLPSDVEGKIKDFVGREFVFAALETFWNAHDRGYFVISGEPGIGKTALAAVGVKRRHLNLFAPIEEEVSIPQKTVKHTPVQKLYNGFIALLAGAHGLVEINRRLRADQVLQAAFGREACAEQSVVPETLDACTPPNVEQMRQAVDTVSRRRSQGFRHC
jgi:hypothetical protein